jgi:TRAP transporter 4TM/12TM fusion protein
MSRVEPNANHSSKAESGSADARSIAAELEEKIEPRRTLAGPLGRLVSVVAVGMGLFQLAVLTVWPIDPWELRSIHLGFVSFLGFLLIRGHKGAGVRPSVVDCILALLSIAAPVYIISNFDDLIYRAGVTPNSMDVIIGGITVVLVIELCRRAIGWALPIITLVFIVYAMVGDYMPGLFWHKGYGPDRLISFLFSNTSIYGVAIAISATYVYLFILFGSILQASGGGKVFIDLAWSLAGWARGGPAKMSIISSSLFGTVSGGAATNVVVDGWLTIPLMKSVGYGARFSAAVEAATSTGGQIVPPVMGAGAFLMAEFVNRPYVDIAVAAIIPSALYYISLYAMIDLEAIKRDLRGLPREQLPRLGRVLINGWHLLMPIVILIGSLAFLGMSPIRAALWASGFGIILSWLRHSSRIGLRKGVTTLEGSAKAVIEIAATCAAAGIVIGTLSMTGLGIKFATILLSYTGGNLLVALFFCMVITLILGMGMPTTAAYVVAASVVAPGLEAMGAPKLGAHMFIFYFACISSLTPPVALAAYAAAAIARADPFQVGITSCRLVIAGFIIPFAFVYGPGLLMQGSLTMVVQNTVTALVGVVALAMAVQGWGIGRMVLPLRLLTGGSALLLIDPATITDLIGVVGLAVVAGWQLLNRRRAKAKAIRSA